MTSFIEVKDLIKEFKVPSTINKGFFDKIFKTSYETIRAVDKISFSIEKGQIAGYIGPNGSGKSTTLKILSGIMIPTQGSVVVNGFVPYVNRKKYVKNIGVVFGHRTHLWYDLPVIDSFNLLKSIYKIPEKIFKQRIEMFNDIFALQKFILTPVKRLSLGQRVRADFAAALLHSPNILFLDEPTIGLDIVVKEKIREFIKFINKTEKVTIIITTHDIIDIERLCDKLIIIDNGQIAYDGSIIDIKNKLENTSIEDAIKQIYTLYL